MMITYKTLYGFEFVKIGCFILDASPILVTYRGKGDTVNVSINFVDDLFKKSDESTYLILSDDEPVYVGEFSYNFEDRWLRNGCYIWHNKDFEIEEALKNHKEVSVWLIVDPFVALKNGTIINISKSIEQEILKNSPPLWNKRGQLKKYADWRLKNCIPVSTIIEKVLNKLIKKD